MRLLISILGPVLALSLLAGCDRQKEVAPQGNQATTTAPGKGVDRSHSGTPAPDVPFRDPEGEQTGLASFKGKPLLLNLWATWCAPCVKELPTLDALAARGGTLQIVTLSQDMGDQAKVRAFLADHKLDRLEAWQDPDMAVPGALGVQVLPATILYDAKGREIWRYNGEMDWTGPDAAKLLADASR